MRTIIITLTDAVKTKLEHADKLEKTDKIIFMYQNENDSISIPVHNMLNQLICATEFVEYEKNVLVHMAFLAGEHIAKGSVVIIDCSNSYEELSILDKVTVTDNFKFAINGKLPTMKKNTTRKPREKNPEIVKTNKTQKTESKEKIEVKKTRTKAASEKSENSDRFAEFKKFLSTCKTDKFDPCNHTMSLYMGIRDAIKSNIPVTQGIEKALIANNLIELSKEAFVGQYSKLEAIVKKTM